MFTGIIDCLGTVVSVEHSDANLLIRISSNIAGGLGVGQSVNHNGVCLTITFVSDAHHEVTAIKETLERSNLGWLQKGDSVNLERALAANGRFDGHIVQGHIDDMAECISIDDLKGSKRFSFRPTASDLVVEKGSIALNGVSLTVSSIGPDSFSVDIIPFTLQETTFGAMVIGDRVNVEYDIIGKYVRNLVRKS